MRKPSSDATAYEDEERGGRRSGAVPREYYGVLPDADAFRGRKDLGEVEFVMPPADSVIHWNQHGYPDPSIRWHHHEDIEFHLIREGPGTMLIGDAMVPFAAGQVTMIGSNVPHMWLSNLNTAREFPRRDVYCQVRPRVFEQLIRMIPDTAALAALMERSKRVISLTGASAAEGWRLLERMREHSGLSQFIDLLELVQVFAAAPQDEWHTILLHDYVPDGSRLAEGDDRVNAALDYVAIHLTDGTLSLESTAASVGMSPSMFSRAFHRISGRTFSDFVRRLRIALACRLLVSGNDSVSEIPAQCGYANLSNFNRRFRQETGMTPSEYRRAHRSG